MTAEFRRLGKRGAYRLGQLRAQGVREHRPPKQLQPRFVRQRPRRWSTLTWLVGFLGGALVIAITAELGLWFVPFVAGAAVGVANRCGDWSWRVAVPAVALMAAVGCTEPLVVGVVRGLPSDAAARVIAAHFHLPADAAAGLVLVVAVAVAQAVSGYWLGRTLTFRPAQNQVR